jgi:hypothetical protein
MALKEMIDSSRICWLVGMWARAVRRDRLELDESYYRIEMIDAQVHVKTTNAISRKTKRRSESQPRHRPPSQIQVGLQ